MLLLLLPYGFFKFNMDIDCEAPILCLLLACCKPRITGLALVHQLFSHPDDIGNGRTPPY